MTSDATNPFESENGLSWQENLREFLGQLTPDQKVQLIEAAVKSMRQWVTEAGFQDCRANLDRLRRVLATLAVHNPPDGFSNRDHDQTLYGERG